MAPLAELAGLVRELDGSCDPGETRRLGDAVARGIVAARPALLGLEADAVDESGLADARAALDRAQERVTARWDTRPGPYHVVVLRVWTDCDLDTAVLLLGGHPRRPIVPPGRGRAFGG